MGAKRIRVKVIARARRGKRMLVLRWEDRSGTARERSTGLHDSRRDRRAAERMARDLETNLQSGDGGEFSWQAFDSRYREEHLSALSAASQSKWSTVCDRFEREINPQFLADVDSAMLSRFAAALRKSGLAETTVAGYLRQLKAAIYWAYDLDLASGDRPRYKPTRRARGFSSSVRFRSITTEEFERMLSQAPTMDDRLFLQSMYWGSLRINEAVKLTWHRSAFCVDFTGSEPRYRILAEAEKGHRDRLLPITPDWASILTENQKSRGRVAKVFSKRTMQKKIKEWAKAANVYVSDDKFCSAQDLRIAFGTRWASRVATATLKELMRHQDIATTEKYYVRLDSDEISRQLREQYGGDAKPIAKGDQTGDQAEATR